MYATQPCSMSIMYKNQLRNLISENFSRAVTIDFLDQYNFGIIIQEKSNFIGCLLSRKCNEMHTLECFCVSKEHRGNNLGQEMLDLLEEHLIGDLSLHVNRNKTDHKLVAYYTRLGFETVYVNDQETFMIKKR